VLTHPERCSVVVTWAGSADTGGSGLAGYRVTRDGAPLAELGPDALEFVDTAPTPGRLALYEVRAFDVSGNESEAGTARAGAPSCRVPPGPASGPAPRPR